MLAKNIEELPERMRTDACRRCLALLKKKRPALAFKRFFDLLVSMLGLAVCSPLLCIIAVLVAATSRGGVFFVQERIGQNLRPFYIVKFRTMASGGAAGLLLTTKDDARITRVGRMLRRLHLDELPQLLNVLKGEMSLVGPRPEVRRYVDLYREAYLPTLLIRPGITCTASLLFRNENDLLAHSGDAERYYLTHILPEKMKHNLRYLQTLGPCEDLRILFATAGLLFFKEK